MGVGVVRIVEATCYLLLLRLVDASEQPEDGTKEGVRRGTTDCSLGVPK